MASLNHIRMTARRVDSNPNMVDGGDMDHWKCVLTRRDPREAARRMTVYFSQGYGHHGKEPKLAAVLECLAMDARGVEDASSFEDWASEYGYDADSRKAESIWRVCGNQALRLRRFLGAAQFTELLHAEEALNG